MASTTFFDQQTVIFADWLNDTNNAIYNGIFVSPTITSTNMICNGTASGAGFTALVNNVFSAPAAIGSAIPNTGAFTTLTSTTLTSTSLTTNAISGSSPLTIRGSTSGTINLAVPATAGTNTITLPAVTGTAVVSGQNSAITVGTPVNSTSGTTVDITSIPSWVKRITVMFNGVSTNGSSYYILQLGSTTFTTSGYLGGVSHSGSASYNSTGLLVYDSPTAASVQYGCVTLSLVTGNTWVSNGILMSATQDTANVSGGLIALGGTLDRIRLTTLNGTDTFDAGSINIQYE